MNRWLRFAGLLAGFYSGALSAQSTTQAIQGLVTDTSGAVVSGAKVTVTNVDNGRTMQCTNVGNIGLPAGVDVVIHTDIFSELGDLIDAPLSVRISW